MRTALAAALLLLASPALAAPLEGRARVLDGDTIEVRGERIRIHGIDAPEDRQSCRDRRGQRYSCSRAATEAMRELVRNQRVACERRDVDAYGRTIAVCRVGRVDIGAAMVRRGHALAFRRYSEDYVAQEARAREARRGMWAGSFEPPWVWREKQREAAAARAAAQTAPKPGCDIKGNVNRQGERIYHVPGGRHYARTRVDSRAGGRWFCSESEAREAGWRASRGG